MACGSRRGIFRGKNASAFSAAAAVKQQQKETSKGGREFYFQGKEASLMFRNSLYRLSKSPSLLFPYASYTFWPIFLLPLIPRSWMLFQVLGPEKKREYTTKNALLLSNSHCWIREDLKKSGKARYFPLKIFRNKKSTRLMSHFRLTSLSLLTWQA